MNSVIKEHITKFIESSLHKQYKLPLIAFSDIDLEIFKKILKSLNISIIDISKQSNINLNCKHFPYTCSEVEHEHYGNNYFDDICNCRSTSKACDYFDIKRTYISFSWNSEYMKHSENCYNDCCCISEVFTRYLIYI